MNRSALRNLVLTGSSLALLLWAATAVAQNQNGDNQLPAKAEMKTTAPAEPKVPEKIRTLMQDRDFAGAVTALEEAIKAGGNGVDYLAYLKGRALHLQQKYDEAAAAFELVEKNHPGSPWARRARFGKALSLMRKGDFRQAEQIYRKEVEYLLSQDRKQEIVDIYLEFAASYFKPTDIAQKPNYQKALEFYQQALAVGPKPEKKAEIDLQIGRCFQHLNNHQEAVNRFTQFIKDHPDSTLLIEARFRLGEAQLALGQPVEARRTWQDLLALHSDSKNERLAEAAYQISATYGLPNAGSSEDLSLGVAALESFLKKYPDHKLAGAAHYRIALSYFNHGRHEDSVKAIQRFLANAAFADREETPDARQLLGRAFQLQKKYKEALAAWQDYLTKHPAHKAWSEVQREIVNTEYLLGEAEREAKHYDAARKLWTEFVAKYPLDARNPGILFLFGQMNAVQEKWADAITDWKRLVSTYPNTNEASQGQFLIAQTLEQRLNKYDEALQEYKKVTWGSFTTGARQAVARLTAKTFTIATERTFRSNETPTVKLVSRNLESVNVRIYKVNLETYFRKMHLANGVESLDIALIDPDKSFEFKVPKYAEFQQLESAIDIPLKDIFKGAEGSGVAAVTVSSKKHEATTLVVQSDLDLIVKSSRDEVFVFAENMRTGKPWAKAKLLVSNGKQIFAEAETGDDGVFKQTYKELKEAGDVRVFGIATGHTASNLVSLNGVGAAQGVTDRAYIFTERPAYRAGQMVHVRGIVRRAENDEYQVDAGKEYTLDVIDVRNRLVYQQDTKLSEFGSMHANFVLPTTSPAGQYRVILRDKDQHTYEGYFTVHEYQLEPVQLVVTTDRKVFYRGEEIEGKITAKFYYGAPLVGREIRYALANGRVQTAKTDDKGEVSFKLPTRDFREAQLLPLSVSLPERNVQTVQNFFLATQGFGLSLSTVRPVFVAGETFEVTVKAADAEGKPTAQKLTLRVAEQTNVDGKVGEREVEKFEIATNDKEGLARKTLKLEKGATYIVRAEGTDRFDNLVSGQMSVQISDEEDQVRLRILADKHTYKAGDTATVKLHWREEPALALVTFQGAKVLDYKLLELKKGANDFKIPLTAKLAPNFDLSVAVMTDTRPDPKDKKKQVVRFHQAASPFQVERDLQVKITHERKGGKGPVRPGDEMELKITTTDPQGKPVAAEVSLAMIDQALLDLFGQSNPEIQSFFQGAYRQSAVRMTSTVTFAYRPKSRPINAQLLAEAERVELAAEEAARIRDGWDVAGADPMSGEPGINATTPTDNDLYLRGHLELPRPQGQPQATPDLANNDFAVQSDAASQGGQGQQQLGLNRWGTIPQQQAANAPGDPSGAQPNQAAQMYFSANTYGGAVQAGSGTLTLSGANGYTGGTVINGGTLNLSNGTVNPGANFNTSGNWANNGYLGDTNANGDDFNGRVSNLTLLNSGNTLAVNPSNLRAFVQEGRRDAVMVLSDGRQMNVNFTNSFGGKQDDKAVTKLAEELTKTGAVLLPAVGSQETGYWNPVVVTDKSGNAMLTITVPENSTAWKLFAKGITTATLAGEATSELTVKKDLFGELKLPAAFTDGDDAEIGVTVHNDLTDKDPITVTLKTTIGGKSTEEKKTLKVTKKGLEELAFKLPVRRPEGQEAARSGEIGATFQLTVAVGETTDNVRRFVPIRPYGLPVFASAGGSATGDATAWVEPPKDLPLTAPGLQIIVGPTVSKSLLDIVLEPGPMCQLEASLAASSIDLSTSDLMACLALQKSLSDSRDQANPHAAALDARIRAAVGQLVSAQRDDGGWSWSGKGQAAHRFTSARVLWALSLAKGAGYKVSDEALDKSRNYLNQQIAATAETDYETKAILLHGLSTAGQGDFTLANRLYRNRAALSNGALVHLILAFVEMDRKQIAEELLGLLKERNLDDAAMRRGSALGSLPWTHSPVELRALYALALERTNGDAAKTKELVDWLMAHRTGHRWAPEKATGPAALAVCTWFAKTKFEDEHYKLTIFVNDNQVQVLDVTKETATQTVEVPTKFLKDGKQRINFQLAGRGRYTYQCNYGGFVTADKLKSTTLDFKVVRHHEPAPQELDGQEIPRGFDVLQGSITTFRNPLTQLPVGKRGQVELQISRYNIPANTPEDQLEYLVVTEPLPAGVTVVENSIKGGFERFEIQPGAITFYVGSRHYIEAIRFDVHGYTPGTYKAGPTVLRNAYRPEQLAVATTKTLTVLPLGAKSADEYQLSPRELFEFGKRLYAKHDYQAAGGHLANLLAKWNTNNETYKESARMMLDIRLQTGPAQEIVRYFEIIKEKWPDLEVPFDKIVKVAAAYHDIGEYERSFLVFRATLESSFLRESTVAGFLDKQGEFGRSVDVMARLLSEYPPEPYVAAATYALTQTVYAKAPQAANDPKLREKKINRVDLIQKAVLMLDNFLTAHPDDPAADQASFSLANAVLDLKLYKETIAKAEQYAKRYPQSDYLDSFWYISGYSHFALGEHEKALALCRKVAEHKRLEKGTGREIESPNRFAAMYILGQVYHSLGEAAKAIAEYTKVEERFADAKQAIEYFNRKDITLPEVTTIKPGDKGEVELKFRNVAAVDVKVYRIDLMKYSLLKRNLGGITQINLAGISPSLEETVELGDGHDYRDRSKKLTVPVKEEGAYLVVCRGGDLHTSGLVLVSPLVVEVQEECASGRVRTTIKDVLKDKYVNDVHVKVIGSRNNDFTSGQTDLRGVYTADSIRGKSTVIAQADGGRYAFYRGSEELGPPPPAPNAPAAPAPPPPGKSDGKKPSGGNELLEELQRGNNDIQMKQQDYLKRLQDNKKSGVDAKSAF